ncbi:MAG: hypothetical protein Q4A21_00035 [bacterium]|nr:hypothetical protein [bacterium]
MVKEVHTEVSIEVAKPIKQVTDILRAFASTYKGSIQNLQGDVLSAFDDRADIEVLIEGQLGILGGLRYFRHNSLHDVWALQVYVKDMGNFCRILIITMGHKSFWPVDGLANPRASKDKEVQLIEMLQS